MRLAHAPLVLALAACAEPYPLAFPSSSATKSVLLIQKQPSLGITHLYSTTPPFEALLALGDEEPGLAFEFDRELDALGLEPGTLTLTAASQRRALVPTPLARYALTSAELVKLETSTVGLELPELDRAAILASGRCVEVPGYVSSACGSTTSFDAFQVQRPALPALSPESCPSGWSPREERIDRGPSLGELVQAYCQPPSRKRCGPHQMQAVGDAECRAVGTACPAGDFATVTATRVIYVRAGAVGGTGTPGAPYARIGQAVAALADDRGAIALAPGSYAEDVVLRGEVDLVGACASATEILGSLSLRAHQGAISNVRLRGNARGALNVEAGSRSRLTAVELSGATGLTGCTIAGGEVHFEDALLSGDDGQRMVGSEGKVELDRSELRGLLVSNGTEISILGSVLSSTGSDLLSYARDATVTIERSRMRVPFVALGESRLTARRSWFDLDVSSETVQRGSLFSEGVQLTVEQSVFATRTVLVPEPQFEGQPTVGQISITTQAADVLIRDCVFLQPQASTRAFLSAIVILHPRGASPGPARLERLLVVGGTLLPQISTVTDVMVSDLSSYLGSQAIFATEGSLRLSRFEAARVRVGVEIAAVQPMVAELSDLRIADATSIGLMLRGPQASLDVDIRRALLLSSQRDSRAVSIRADSDNRVEVRVRDLKIDAQVSTGLELGVDARLDLERFSVAGAATGLLLHHQRSNGYVPRGLHLRRGVIDASVLGVWLPDVPVDLDLLLDQVTLKAPTLFKEQ